MAYLRRFTSFLATLVALFTVLAVNVPGAVAMPLHPAQETGGGSGKTYVIATDTLFAPFEFRDSSGELTGIDIKIMEAVAEDQGFQVEWCSLGFNAALQALSADQADGVIAGMSITDERKEVYDFSDPYFTGTMTLAVNEDQADEILSWDDLLDKRLMMKTGSMSKEVARERQDQYGYEITSLDQTTTLVESVKSGNADVLMDDYPVIAYGVQQGSGLVTVVSRSRPATTVSR